MSRGSVTYVVNPWRSPVRSLNPPAAAAQPRPVAVIEVGTTSIRMAIAEVEARGSIRMLEALSQGVTLGKDSFTRGEIGKQTIEDCVRVLKAYRRKLEEYGIRQVDQVRVVATSAVREALNQMAFVDRIYIATGLTVQPIDEAEVHRITYRSIQPLLAGEPRFTDGHTIICEVGGGSTELLVVEHGNVQVLALVPARLAAAATVAAGPAHLVGQDPRDHRAGKPAGARRPAAVRPAVGRSTTADARRRDAVCRPASASPTGHRTRWGSSRSRSWPN